jgi:hypothetical protein
MFPMGTIFSPVSLGTSEEEVSEALAGVRAARALREQEIAAGARRANAVVLKNGVVVVTSPVEELTTPA